MKTTRNVTDRVNKEAHAIAQLRSDFFSGMNARQAHRIPQHLMAKGRGGEGGTSTRLRFGDAFGLPLLSTTPLYAEPGLEYDRARVLSLSLSLHIHTHTHASNATHFCHSKHPRQYMDIPRVARAKKESSYAPQRRAQKAKKEEQLHQRNRLLLFRRPRAANVDSSCCLDVQLLGNLVHQPALLWAIASLLRAPAFNEWTAIEAWGL